MSAQTSILILPLSLQKDLLSYWLGGSCLRLPPVIIPSFIGPCLPLEVFKLWSLDMLEMQILRPNQDWIRRSGVGSPQDWIGRSGVGSLQVILLHRLENQGIRGGNLTILFFFFWDRVLLCRPGRSAVAWSRLTMSSAILLPQPPK